MGDDATTSSDEAKRDDSVGAIIARMGPASILAVLWAVLPAVLGLTLFVGYRGEVAVWLQDQGLAVGLAIYVGVFAVSAGLGLLPTWVQAVIGGYAFGMVYGFVGALAGFTAASLVGFAVAKVVARDRVEGEIDLHRKALAVRQALVGRGPASTLWTVMLVRFPPNSPFALTNLVLTSVKVPLWVYALGTATGMAPRTLAYAWMGTQVSDWDKIEKPSWLIWGGIVLTVGVLMLLAHIGNRAIEKVTRPDDSDASAPSPPTEPPDPGSSPA